ncbi:MAG: DUF302 domain-containing protein [Campylobacterales bacterium]|nr:DUF302 domain-containing protein [Campylobacterales bacterium]
MKKIWFILALLLLLLGCSNNRGNFIHTLDSNESVDKTTAKLVALIKKAKLTHFDTFDHTQNAKEQNLTLRPTKLIVFGNPHMETKLIQCNQSIGIDMPMKILVYEDFNGDTKISYTNPEYFSLKHNIKDTNCLNIINKASIALDAITAQVGKK